MIEEQQVAHTDGSVEQVQVGIVSLSGPAVLRKVSVGHLLKILAIRALRLCCTCWPFTDKSFHFWYAFARARNYAWSLHFIADSHPPVWSGSCSPPNSVSMPLQSFPLRVVGRPVAAVAPVRWFAMLTLDRHPNQTKRPAAIGRAGLHGWQYCADIHRVTREAP